MKVRIYEQDDSLRTLLDLICRMVSADVEISGRPILCKPDEGLQQHESCPGHCGSLVIVDAHMQPLSGLDWTRLHCTSGCRVSPDNILLLTTHISEQDKAMAASLGCSVMRKPFNTQELLAWLRSRFS